MTTGKFFLNFYRNTSLSTQLTLILFLLYLLWFVAFLGIFKLYYSYHYNKIIHSELKLIKNTLSPALIPLILTEDYNKIEKYLIDVVKDSNIDYVELIDSMGKVLLSISIENSNHMKVTYLPPIIRNKITEEIVENNEHIIKTIPIKTGDKEKALSWLLINYSKRDLKSLYNESFIISLSLLFTGAIFSILLLRVFFYVIHRDLREIISYLFSLPGKKGKPFSKALHSKEANDLKHLAEELSTLLDQKEKEILQEKYKLEEILSALTEGVVFTDYQLKILYYNQAFLDLIDYNSKVSIIGSSLKELLKIYDKDLKTDLWGHIYPLLKLANEEGLSHGLSFEEAYVFEKNSTAKVLEISLTPLNKEFLKGFLFIFHDITHRKLIEREIQRIQKFEALDKLAGGVAHDLRNLLAGLYNYLHILKMKPSLKKEASQEIWERIDKLLNRASALSFQLLSLSKGGTPIKEATNVVELLREVAEFCFSGFPVEFEIKTHTPLGKILFDPHQIAQVFQNIFINAREAMPDGGKVTVELDIKTLKDEEIPPLPPGKYLHIIISDTGIGIAPEILPHIFDPFFTTKEKGSGLGLSVVFQIINNHGGHITVSSEPGKGASFHLYLPYEEASHPDRHGDYSTDNLPQRGGYKVLVVDDEEDIREALKLILSELGHTVETASQGNEAIPLFKKALESKRPFEVVITDFTMPDMTGDKLVKTLKDIYPSFLAILTTGYADIPAVSDYKSYGFDRILLKPYTIEQLQEVLTQDNI